MELVLNTKTQKHEENKFITTELKGVETEFHRDF